MKVIYFFSIAYIELDSWSTRNLQHRITIERKPIVGLKVKAKVLFGLFLVTGYAAAQLEPGSTWWNQSGSMLTIEHIGSDGKITGTYTNGNTNFNCVGTPYPVTGWVSGNVITFTVSWNNRHESCGSLTAWTGFYEDGKITALWQLVREGTAATDKIYRGEAVFTPKPPGQSGEVQRE